MNAATGHFSSTAAIVLAIKTQLTAVKLADNTTAAFQRVEMFDDENLGEAFQTLLMSEQRIAVIVPLTARWETESGQRKLVTRRVQPVAILISDRVLGNRTLALYGGASNPGAFVMCARTVPAVSGQLIPNPAGVISKPVNESVMTLKKEDKQNLPGRAVVVLEVDCQGGWLEAALGAGPTL